MSLNSERLAKDPRYIEAKKLFAAALQDAQKEITDIHPPQDSLKADYATLLEAYSTIRGFPLYYPYMGSSIGNGALVELLDGSIKYDMITGIGVSYFGHSHQGLCLEALDAAMSDTIMQGNLQLNADSYTLVSLLTTLSGLAHCFLTTSGAMACENSLKICFQKKFPADRILAFENCFSGRTCLLSQISDKPANREGLPTPFKIDYIPFFDATKPEESTKKALQVLDTYLTRYPKQYAVMCMELIQGEGGFWVGSTDFFKKIIAKLKEHGVLVWVDEVQTFLRTDHPFAYQHFGLENLVDTVTIGKALQASATLFTRDLCPRPGLLSQTFTASTSAIRTASFIIKESQTMGLFGKEGKNRQVHNAMTSHFERLKSQFGEKIIRGPYGIGGMIGCTLFDGDLVKTKEFLQKLFTNGVIAFFAGKAPCRVRFLPPLGVMDDKTVNSVMMIFEKTLQESL